MDATIFQVLLEHLPVKLVKCQCIVAHVHAHEHVHECQDLFLKSVEVSIGQKQSVDKPHLQMVVGFASE